MRWFATMAGEGDQWTRHKAGLDFPAEPRDPHGCYRAETDEIAEMPVHPAS
jgi:hypothetical protein